MPNGWGYGRIEDQVVAKIAGLAADKVEGVRRGSGASLATGGILASITGEPSPAQGVSVEVSEDEVAINLTVAVEYGKPIPEAMEAVGHEVKSEVENLTGLKVTDTQITVADVFFPVQEAEEQRQSELEQQRWEQETQQQQRDQRDDLEMQQEGGEEGGG